MVEDSTFCVGAAADDRGTAAGCRTVKADAPERRRAVARAVHFMVTVIGGE